MHEIREETREELERLAEALYDECQTVRPLWEQLGETTKGVWRDYVRAGLRPAVVAE